MSVAECTFPTTASPLVASASHIFLILTQRGGFHWRRVSRPTATGAVISLVAPAGCQYVVKLFARRARESSKCHFWSCQPQCNCSRSLAQYNGLLFDLAQLRMILFTEYTMKSRLPYVCSVSLLKPALPSSLLSVLKACQKPIDPDR